MNAHTSPSSILLVFIMGLLVTGCAQDSLDNPDGQGSPGTETAAVVLLKSDAERAVGVNSALEEPLSHGMWTFGADLLQILHNEGPEENVLLSPTSLTFALGMILGGAEGETRTQLAHGLRLKLDVDDLHPALNALEQDIADRIGSGDSGQLSVHNAVWLDDGFDVTASFLDLLAQHYGAGVFMSSFRDAASHEAIAEHVNQWVDEGTSGLIDQAITTDMLSQETVALLINTLYLKAAWSIPFPESETAQGLFQGPAGERTVDMMHTTFGEARFVEVEGYEALTLYTSFPGLLVHIVLPPEALLGHAPDGEAIDALRAVLRQSERAMGSVTMPRTRVESGYELSRAIADHLGASKAFIPEQAEFHAMGVIGGLEASPWLQFVDHQVVLDINEEGIEAAAVTAGGMLGPISYPEQIVDLVVDRPYLFIVTLGQNLVPLIMAYIQNPLIALQSQ